MRRIVLLCLLVSPLAGCKKISAGKVEELIVNMFKEKGVDVKAGCPDGLDIKKGSTFKCFAKEGGRELTINVEVLDEEGTVRAVLDGMFVFTEKFIPAVKERDGLDVKCPQKTMVVSNAQHGFCDVIGSDQFKQVEITPEDPDKGLINWKAI